MQPALLLALCLVTFLASVIGTRILLWALTKRHIMDIPNQRSNHTIPTPRGAGLAVITALLLGLAVWYAYDVTAIAYVPYFLIAGALAVFSFLDDVTPLPISLRFAMQLAAVTASLWFFPGEGKMFQGIFPSYVDTILTALLWVWFINLYNFMDGIDGITGIETASIGIGIAVMSIIAPHYSYSHGIIGIMLLATAGGFLVWNWHPAKIFLGDSGSISLGYLLGWLLIDMAKAGHWLPALLIPGYYLFDSTFTLLRRILRGEKFWQAHSEHFYQKAVRAGISPRKVVYLLAITNGILLALATYLVVL